MPKSIQRTYSRYSHDAAKLLSGHIRAARLERKLTLQEIADRAGISRGLLQRIEKGDMKCEIGVVFEVAAIVGVTLFEDSNTLSGLVRQQAEKLTLMPKVARKPKRVVDDEF